MRVVVAGAAGMLGGALTRALGARGHSVVALTRADLDIRSLAQCRRALPASVDAVVNAAAWVDVDGAESAEGAAFDVNATGAANLAIVSREVGARLVQVSTDYVFDGFAISPYAEDAPLRPISAYGRTKAAGEWAVRAEHPMPVVVRTAWLYGPGSQNFVATMAGLAASRETVDVVDDQRGQPTTTRDVAAYIVQVLESGAPAGTYHATSEGETTWHGLARAIFEELALDPDRVRPTKSAAFSRPAPRPAYSVLGHDHGERLGIVLPHWRDALSATLADTLEHTRG